MYPRLESHVDFQMILNCKKKTKESGYRSDIFPAFIASRLAAPTWHAKQLPHP
jgi:hypothetical protein